MKSYKSKRVYQRKWDANFVAYFTAAQSEKRALKPTLFSY